jgi:hypothetical protein
MARSARLTVGRKCQSCLATSYSRDSSPTFEHISALAIEDASPHFQILALQPLCKYHRHRVWRSLLLEGDLLLLLLGLLRRRLPALCWLLSLLSLLLLHLCLLLLLLHHALVLGNGLCSELVDILLRGHASCLSLRFNLSFLLRLELLHRHATLLGFGSERRLHLSHLLRRWTAAGRRRRRHRGRDGERWKHKII